MRSILSIAILLAAGSAQADWTPRVISDQFVTTLNYGGGALSYREDASKGGPVWQAVSELMKTPNILQQGLNGRVAQLVSQNGATFLSGTVSGNAQVTIRPDASGVAYISLSGLNYQVRNRYSGRKLGVINYSCTNTLTLSNMVLTAQYGTADGSMAAGKAGMTATTSSSTDCDSNLSWILPVVGDVLISKAEGKIDSAIQSGVQASLAQVKDALLYKPGQNLLSGLNKLVPADKVVSLPDGRTFPVGRYVQDNFRYLLGNSQITLRLGNYLQVQPVNQDPGMYSNAASELLSLNLSSPAFALGLKVNEEQALSWSWNSQCDPRHPETVCQEP
ncbi:hypothetical protein ABH309_13595 [Chromobacterium piscinae]|uniref:Uncharacterized protein n=1 Tax=Chromobacterium piscinae TaxID=686831 RepID=A0ABV0H740_9NEIS